MKLVFYFYKYSNLGLNLVLTSSSFMTLAKLVSLRKLQVKTTCTLQDSELIRNDTCIARCPAFRSHQRDAIITILIMIIIGM